MEVMQENTSGMCCKLSLLLDAKTHQLYFKSSVTHHTIMQKTTPTIIYLLSALFFLWGSKVMTRCVEGWELGAAGRLIFR